MSMDKLTERLGKEVDRRRFLGTAGKAALGALVVIVGGTPDRAEAYHTNCSNYNTNRKVYCCNLGYTKTCSSTESSNCFQYGTSHPS